MRQLQLADNLDMLRAFFLARTTGDTLCLVVPGISLEHIAALLLIIRLKHHSLVVELENLWNGYALWTWHTVFTARAGDGYAALVCRLDLLLKLLFFGRHGVGSNIRPRENLDIILQLLHCGDAA